MSARPLLRSPAFSTLTAIACWVLLAIFVSSSAAQPPGCLSEKDLVLIDLINDYRQQNGKAPIPVSVSLTTVAQWKVLDMASPANPAGQSGCNLHSWSAEHPELWSGCCYTPDHAEASCMWNKPREVTGNVYAANGYENAAAGYTTVEQAFAGWQNSSGHNDVILNLGIWASRDPWPAMAVGVDEATKKYVIWFGDAVDPAGEATPCVVSSTSATQRLLTRQGIHPNPFNPRTTISFRLSAEVPVRVTVHDLQGRKVRTLADGAMAAGDHELLWDGLTGTEGPAASGVYVVRIDAGNEAWTQKISLLK